MRVIRDVGTGRILVEVADQQYTHIREIADAQVGRRVLWAIADLIRFTGGMASNAQAVRSAAQQEAHEHDLLTAKGVGPAEDGATDLAKDTAIRSGAHSTRLPPPSVPAAPALPSTDRGVRYSLSAFFRRGFQPPGSPPLPEPSSFVEEIEDTLQELIAQRSGPLPHEVHVRVGPTNRLQVEVGPKVYDSAGEVPDPEVRALIQAAVSAWEKG
jgi:hypothetical protein